MPSYKDDPPDQEYLDSIKRHTDKKTNKVNLALVAKDFGYTSGKSFQKRYVKLKKAHKLTNGHIYGDYRPVSSTSTQAPASEAPTLTPEVATPEVATPPPEAATTAPEVANPESATIEGTRTPPKETTKEFVDTLTPEVKRLLRPHLLLWHQALVDRDAEDLEDAKKGKRPVNKAKSYILPRKTYRKT